MARSLLLTLGCAIVALCVMRAGQHAANVVFPVTHGPLPSLTNTPVSVSEIPSIILVPLYVPFWAPIAHLAACVVAALIGGYLAARLTPATFWPVWTVAAVLSVWELVAVADIPKDVSFSVFAAATCIAGAWLGAVAYKIRSKRSSE